MSQMLTRLLASLTIFLLPFPIWRSKLTSGEPPEGRNRRRNPQGQAGKASKQVIDALGRRAGGASDAVSAGVKREQGKLRKRSRMGAGPGGVATAHCSSGFPGRRAGLQQNKRAERTGYFVLINTNRREVTGRRESGSKWNVPYFPSGFLRDTRRSWEKDLGQNEAVWFKCMGPGGGQTWIRILEPQFPDSVIRFLGTLVLLSAEWEWHFSPIMFPWRLDKIMHFLVSDTEFCVCF